eukprot:SAG11_NODE_141_length_14934_cov_4.821503_9_plen_181_part_00
MLRRWFQAELENLHGEIVAPAVTPRSIFTHWCKQEIRVDSFCRSYGENLEGEASQYPPEHRSLFDFNLVQLEPLFRLPAPSGASASSSMRSYQQDAPWLALRARLRPVSSFLNMLLDVWRIRFGRLQAAGVPAAEPSPLQVVVNGGGPAVGHAGTKELAATSTPLIKVPGRFECAARCKF